MIAVDTVFAVKPENRLFDLGDDAGVLTSVKDKARTRAGLRPSLTCVARAGLRGRRSGRRNDPRAIEQRNRRRAAAQADMAMRGSNGLPVFRTPKQRTRSLRIAAMTICL